MKRLLLLILASTTLSGCLYVVDPVYDYRNNVVGYYEVEEYSHTYNDYFYYAISISKNAYSSDEITISNFYAANISVRASVSYNKITIPYQIVNGYEVEGTGTVNGNRIDMSYRVRDLYDNEPSDFCDASAYVE